MLRAPRWPGQPPRRQKVQRVEELSAGSKVGAPAAGAEKSRIETGLRGLARAGLSSFGTKLSELQISE